MAPSQSNGGPQCLLRFRVVGVQSVGHTDNIVSEPGRRIEFQRCAERVHCIRKTSLERENLPEKDVSKLGERVEVYAVPEF